MFLDGTTVIATENLVGNTATFSTSSLAVGSHSITVSYGGDGNFTSSTSSAITETVNQSGTTTALTSSLNPSTAGQSVSFTATVSPKSPGAGQPTGSVTFYNGNTVLGTIMLNGSDQATFTTSSLSVGNHTITADYSGDGNFKASNSSSLRQTVNSGLAVVLPIEYKPLTIVNVASIVSSVSTRTTTDLALASLGGLVPSGGSSSQAETESVNTAASDQLFASLGQDDNLGNDSGTGGNNA
jgi:hypothetical protein